MEINNYHSIKRVAERNYDQFDKHLSIFVDFGSNDKMINNLQDMKNKLNKLLTDGDIKDGEFDHKHLDGFLEGALKIHHKPKKSLEDITEFYKTYNNFNDVYKTISGDEK